MNYLRANTVNTFDHAQERGCGPLQRGSGAGPCTGHPLLDKDFGKNSIGSCLYFLVGLNFLKAPMQKLLMVPLNQLI